MLFGSHHAWPDAVDLAATFVLFGVAIAATVSGHIFLVLDVRAWIRSLRRALIVVADHLPHFPRWTRTQTPRCLASLGMHLPCNEDQLLRRYRELVKRLHPDRGGDRKRFMRLQSDFEEAMAFLQRLTAERVDA